MTTFGTYYDFQKKGAVGCHYEELINSCQYCHYSGYISDFDTIYSKERKDEIRSYLKQFALVNIDDVNECKIAGDLANFMHKSNNKIANYYLIGSYLARFDSIRNELRVSLQLETSDYLEKAIQNNEYKDSSSVATIYYLIAEMNRRASQYDKAIEYYDKAINDPNKMDWVEEVATKQKEIAINKDNNNKI